MQLLILTCFLYASRAESQLDKFASSNPHADA